MAGAGKVPGTTPVTELDARFGEDGAEAVPWAEALGLLERAELSWLTTVDRQGRPHVTPVLTVVVDGTLRFSTGPSEQKAKNLERSAEVALTTGTNTLHRGTDVVVSGTAVRVVDVVERQRVADLIEAKYGPDWRFDVDELAIFEVVPRVGFGFAKDPFGQTRWKFTET